MWRFLVSIVCICVAAPIASAWDAHGHRTVTYLALDGLGPDFPAWLSEAAIRDRIAEQANEPDRWRGSRLKYLAHENSPEHYLDVDLLEQFGLTLRSLPSLRYEYIRALAIAKHVHPDAVAPYDAAKDPERSKEWPGLLPYAIAEQYAKLQSSFNELRILEKLNDPKRAHQLLQARENVIYHMGVLSHFVGDAAQPLHTTKHFNGWVGPNPENYTTSDKFHSYIDGRVLEKHNLTYATLRPLMRYNERVDYNDPWKDTIEYILETSRRVEPLYRLERDKQLDGEPGKQLIAEQLTVGGAMLAAYYTAAYRSSAPDEKQIADFVRYNNLQPELLPTTAQPATQPADTSAPAEKPRKKKKKAEAPSE